MEAESGVGGPLGDRGLSRRTFLKRMALIGFAAPVVASFALDAAYATPTSDDETGADPDLVFGNQALPVNFFANQIFPNKLFANQTFPNQYFPNQFASNQTIG